MDDTVQEERPSIIPLDKLAQTYIKMRDKRALMKAEWEAKDNEVKAQMEMLEEKMLDTCKEMNADSIKTKFGTIVRSIKSRYWTNDWDSTYEFIKEHNAFGLLEKRLQQTNLKQFLAENPDVYPKGLNVENEYTVLVRRSKEN